MIGGRAGSGPARKVRQSVLSRSTTGVIESPVFKWCCRHLCNTDHTSLSGWQVSFRRKISPHAHHEVLYVLYFMCATLSEFLNFVIPSAPSVHLVGGWNTDENSPALWVCQNGAFKSSPLHKGGDSWCSILLQASHQHCSSEKSS